MGGLDYYYYYDDDDDDVDESCKAKITQGGGCKCFTIVATKC
jgi:hypothetical protein